MFAAEPCERAPQGLPAGGDRRRRCRAVLASGLLMLGLAAPRLAGGAESGGPEAAVDRFYTALEAGDSQAALAELAPEVVIFEQGGAELSREEYAAHHLEADMAYVHATENRVLERRTGGEGAIAWVLTRFETTGTFEGEPVATRGTETMLLERREQGWRIVHVHWSSRKKAK
jgi:ketosteroid isomerase-like protein